MWYEEWDEPGCPLYGDKWPDGDGVTASEACCHCGYDSLSTPSVCHDNVVEMMNDNRILGGLGVAGIFIALILCRSRLVFGLSK